MKEFVLYDFIYMNFKSRPKNKMFRDVCLGDKTFWWFAGAYKEGAPGGSFQDADKFHC